MQRHESTPRPDWPQRVEKIGLTYHLHRQGAATQPYWNEAACYEFSAAEVAQLETAMQELHALLIDVADTVVQRGDWERLAIPEKAVPLVLQSWENDDFSLYGRFDFAWMPGRVPKLLEYNADTPTSLVEASVAQWFWLQDTRPELDQFNSIHERLVAGWKRYASLNPSLRQLDFTSVANSPEDEQTISYLMDTAQNAGFQTRWSNIDELGWDAQNQVFVSGRKAFRLAPSSPLVACFKLYPWEWLWREPAGEHLPQAPTRWIEPAWKALLSNKAILAYAWELHPRQPNLLPCFFDEAQAGRNYVKKPKLSREGANITVVADGQRVVQTPGDYGQEGFVYQALADIPDFGGNRPVIGGWMVDHEPAGLGVRESNGLITDNLSRFVPHFFRP
jgi:glutathionylspermidine synthase